MRLFLSVRRAHAGLGGITVDVENSVGKGLRGFLRQIVPDAAFDGRLGCP